MILLVILGFILICAGIIGCVLPVVPGPPLAYLALILLSIARKWEAFSPAFLIAMGCVAAVVTAIDYVLPLFTAKKYGASKYGVWGAVVGMLIGAIFFPPFGLLIGAFLGAVGFELLFNEETKQSMKAGLGVLIGIVLGIFIKLGASGVMAYFFIKAVFAP
ncbi:MAG TPA: DUF456 domain-containing protein [Spirochaetes bacterium]|nr:DUF456 domain-containing protein [Spirochaetota bacterium]